MNLNANSHVSATEVIGHRTRSNCKAVINYTTGELYASAMDAAEHLGVTLDAVSACCRGKLKTCKGNALKYVHSASGNIDMMAETIRRLRAENEQLKADAEVGRAIREQQEAERKAEEARLKTIEDARVAYNKAKNKFERRQRMVEREEEKYQDVVRRYMEAETEMQEALANLLKLEGGVTE